MSKILSFTLFVSLAVLIITSVHYYLWVRFFKTTSLGNHSHSVGITVFTVLALSFPVAVVLARLIPFKYSFPVLWISYLWLGMMMLLFFSFLFADIVSVLFSAISSCTANHLVENPGRRMFMSNIIASGVGLTVIGATFFGVKNYYDKAVVKKVTIVLKGLPEIFKGFRIVQISDLHIGQLMTGETLREVVESVNRLNPDIIAITGDLADGSVKKFLKEVAPLKDLQAEKGVYFVTGNHEYYSGAANWVRAIEAMGIHVLHNENIRIKKENTFFYLAGVTDHEAKKFGDEHAADFKKALWGLEKDKKKILLAHQPVAVHEAAEYGTDLVLSGHTHGGQIWPFTYLVYLQQPFLKGHYHYKETQLYINQGTGCWGPPMRLGSYNEITEITLS